MKQPASDGPRTRGQTSTPAEGDGGDALTGESPSLLERFDPTGSARRMTHRVRLLTSWPLRPVLRVLGANPNDVDQLARLSRRVQRNMDDLDRRARLLCPLGWLLFERGPDEAYAEAADLVDAGEVEAAEHVLCAAWNEDRAALLRGPLHQIMDIYELPDDDDFVEDTIAFERCQEIQEAMELHLAGHYRGAIHITLAQLDGIAADFAHNGRGLFARNGFDVTDELTAVGHPANLAQIRRLLTLGCPTATLDGRLLRHGIVHGRELRYGTEFNSTKALIALLGLIVFCKARHSHQPVQQEETSHPRAS